MNREYLPN